MPNTFSEGCYFASMPEHQHTSCIEVMVWVVTSHCYLRTWVWVCCFISITLLPLFIIYTHIIYITIYITVKIVFSPKYSWKMPHNSSLKEKYMCHSSAQISATGSYFSVVTRGCFTTRGELPQWVLVGLHFFADEKNILHQAPIVVSQTRCRFRITDVEPIIQFLTQNTLQIPRHGYTMSNKLH